MRDIVEAVLTFLAAATLGMLAQGMCLASGKDVTEAGGVGTCVTILAGMAICATRAKSVWRKK